MPAMALLAPPSACTGMFYVWRCIGNVAQDWRIHETRYFVQ
jgi:hypothetical protein